MSITCLIYHHSVYFFVGGYTVKALVHGIEAIGKGHNKRAAEQDAAHEGLKLLGVNPDDFKH